MVPHGSAVCILPADVWCLAPPPRSLLVVPFREAEGGRGALMEMDRLWWELRGKLDAYLDAAEQQAQSRSRSERCLVPSKGQPQKSPLTDCLIVTRDQDSSRGSKVQALTSK